MLRGVPGGVGQSRVVAMARWQTPIHAELHRGLTESIAAGRVDSVYCAGPLMRELWDALPAAQRGGYAETAEALEPERLEAALPRVAAGGDREGTREAGRGREGPGPAERTAGAYRRSVSSNTDAITIRRGLLPAQRKYNEVTDR